MTKFSAHEYVPCEGACGEIRPQLQEYTRLQELMYVTCARMWSKGYEEGRTPLHPVGTWKQQECTKNDS